MCKEYSLRMTIKIFTCRACNHTNRFGRSTCSYCFRPTTLLNRWVTWGVLALFAGLLTYFSFF